VIPGIPEIPNVVIDQKETPSPSNPMGVKGVGKSGTIGSPSVAINAAIDALPHEGVAHIYMPSMPRKARQVIQNARKTDAQGSVPLAQPRTRAEMERGDATRIRGDVAGSWSYPGRRPCRGKE
jgi:hypothetical protein